MEGHTVQAIDFYDGYKKLCEERNQYTIDWLLREMEVAIDGGDVPTNFRLNGNQEELRRSRIDDLYLDSVLTPLGKSAFVRRLDLSFNIIGNEGARRLAKFLSADNRSVTYLSVRSNNITEEGGIAIADSLVHNKTLRTLDLSDNDLGAKAGMRLACVLQVNTTLRGLAVAATNLGASPIIALATVLKSNETLAAVDLSDNLPAGSVGRETAGTLQQDVLMHVAAMIGRNVGLQEIVLRKLGIGDIEIVDWLAPAIAKNQHLRRIDLSCNHIGRDGGVALSYALHRHPTVGAISLSHNMIQDEGAIAFAGMIMNNTGTAAAAEVDEQPQVGVLQRIDMDHNGVGNAGLRAIAEALTATLETKGRVEYMSLWGNNWDGVSCSCFAGLVGPRLRPGNIDVMFYEVEGRMNVARAANG